VEKEGYTSSVHDTTVIHQKIKPRTDFIGLNFIRGSVLFDLLMDRWKIWLKCNQVIGCEARLSHVGITLIVAI
jgi:hypothetical protein